MKNSKCKICKKEADANNLLDPSSLNCISCTKNKRTTRFDAKEKIENITESDSSKRQKMNTADGNLKLSSATLHKESLNKQPSINQSMTEYFQQQ